MGTKPDDSLQQLMLFNLLRVEAISGEHNEIEDAELTSQGLAAREAYAKAILTAGKERLKEAKRNLQLITPSSNIKVEISGNQARAALARIKASNDEGITLAARGLEQISDNEAIDMIKELIELGAISLKDIT
jgi:hypothetical protein